MKKLKTIYLFLVGVLCFIFFFFFLMAIKFKFWTFLLCLNFFKQDKNLYQNKTEKSEKFELYFSSKRV